MSLEEQQTGRRDLLSVLGSIAHDTERLLGQHVDLVRAELRGGLGEVTPAVASLGLGAGLVATGGVLGSLMLVHGLHRSTRLPLWGCYGLAGGLLTALGVGLLASGARRTANLKMVPRETIAALREDLEWIKAQATHPTS